MREVREQGAVEGDAVQPPLRESVRGHLHRHCLGALLADFLEQALDIERVRGRVGQRRERARKSRAERADDARFCAAPAERGGNPLAAGSLAVGAGDAAHPQRLGGPAVKLRGERAGLLLEPGDGAVRHSPFVPPGKAGLFPHDRRGAAPERLADIGATVGGLARISEERDAGRAAAAVGGEGGDHRAFGREAREQLLGGVVGHGSLVTYFPWPHRPRWASRSGRGGHRARRPSGAAHPA